MLQALAPELVNLMTAGEVIDSPLAVVRELVENALDAQADRIIVRLWLEQWRLEVLDNGVGMDPVALRRCVLPHTTSKIAQLDDLHNIKTLGFRGEALHSLTQVSRVRVASRTGGNTDSGWQQDYAFSAQGSAPVMVPIAVGTRIEVRALFANLPHRRQAIGNLQRQRIKIQHYLQCMALCHPRVTWQLWQQDRLKLQVSPGSTPQDILLQCLPALQQQDLTTVEQSLTPPSDAQNDNEPARLTLTLGYPDRYHRHRPDWVLVAINGRPVHLPELEQTLMGIFHRSLPRHRFPLCFAHLHLPPRWIDWNRHPAKTELYLQDLEHWQAQLKATLTQCLRLSPLVSSRAKTLLKAADTAGSYQLADPQTSLTATVLQPTFSLKAIAQVNRTYIVVEHDQGVWLVEQHVAHERVLFEQLQQQWSCQALVKPLLMSDLTPQQVERLQEFGLEIDVFGEGTWAVRSLPQLLQEEENPIDCLQELSQLTSLVTAQATIACRCAIKNGQPLTPTDYKQLIDQWQQCKQPQTCPHGRPIYLALDESSLARFFRRNWIIGN